MLLYASPSDPIKAVWNVWWGKQKCGADAPCLAAHGTCLMFVVQVTVLLLCMIDARAQLGSSPVKLL